MLTDHTRQQREMNDHRADHRVSCYGFGTNVRFPYKGYVISLSMDGSDTIVEDQEGNLIVNFGEIRGTSGESIREAMEVVDNIK